MVFATLFYCDVPLTRDSFISLITFSQKQEEAKYEKVEKEFESVSELAMEDEEELKYVYLLKTIISALMHVANSKSPFPVILTFVWCCLPYCTGWRNHCLDQKSEQQQSRIYKYITGRITAQMTNCFLLFSTYTVWILFGSAPTEWGHQILATAREKSYQVSDT